MKYKKYENKAYNLHIINTDKFKTIMIKINFKKKIDKMDMTYLNFLTKILLQSSKNYPTKKRIEIACEDLYSLSIASSNTVSGNYAITTFQAFFLNEKFTEKSMNEKTIKFLLDTIFNPNIKDDNFENFDLIKNIVKEEIDSLKDDSSRYSSERLFEEIDEFPYYSSVGNSEYLEKITSKSLYKYYLDMLKKDSIDIFVIGDVNNSEIKKLMEDNFKVNTLKKEKPIHFIEYKKFRNRAKLVKEELPLEQAKLKIGFKLDKLNNFEKQYVMKGYTFILGGSPNSKLFKDVREKNSLCYSINASHKPVSNLMVISAGINEKDYKKALNLIKKEIKQMQKGNFTDEDLQAVKVTYMNSLKDLEDSQSNILNLYESHEYLNFDLIEERKKEIEKITKQDIIKLSKKIHLDTIYLLGGNDEEN